MKHVNAVILAFVAWWLLVPTVIAAEEKADEPAKSEKLCELRIEGQHIKSLRLLDQNGLLKDISQPSDVQHLPPGRYTVERVELDEGYEFDANYYDPGEHFELTPDRPHVLKVGGPLQPTVVVSRQGKCLELNYELRDAEGRSYRQSSDKMDWSSPPQFAIYRDGQEIASGSFAYG